MKIVQYSTVTMASSRAAVDEIDMLRNSLRHALARAAAPRSFTALTAATRPLAAGAPLRLGAVRPLSA